METLLIILKEQGVLGLFVVVIIYIALKGRIKIIYPRPQKKFKQRQKRVE